MQYNRDYNSDSKYDPCASDNSSSRSYENNCGHRMYITAGYLKNIHPGTKEVLNVIESVGFDSDSRTLGWKDSNYNGVMKCSVFFKTLR